MQIVIDISEEMYKWVNDVNKFSDDYGTGDFVDLIRNGIQLPKGHGRLIDADAFKYNLKWNENIDNAPTILEATEGTEVKRIY